MADPLERAEESRETAQRRVLAAEESRDVAEDGRDPVFIQEQAHLSETCDRLRAIGHAAAAAMADLAAEAGEDKRAMAEELATNYATWDDAMETHADFMAMNSIVEGYNRSHALQAEKLAAAQTLLRRPYFAKIVLGLASGKDPKELYIGTTGISDEDCRRLVVDWRSPVAEVYYNQANGPTSYVADGRTIDVDLKLRRQFDIDGDVLHAYFDSDVAIQDSLLLASLSRQRGSAMKAITATIQKEQNVVIRHEDVDVLLVAGIAGSGKTSVMLQRLAYLFYRHRDALDPDEVYLLTPNDVFASYIDEVLPDLGERNPHMLTWRQFVQGLMPEGRGAGEKLVGADGLERIDRALEGFEFAPGDFASVVLDGVTLIPADQIGKISQRFRSIPAGPHRSTLIREELLIRLEARLKQMAATERVRDELEALPVDEQIRILGEIYDPQTEQEQRDGALTYLKQRFAGAASVIERDEWVDIDRVALRLLNDPGLSSTEWLYLKMGITGLSEPRAKYVMIDEVQDYGIAQLAVLTRYFRRARFLLLGDENQSITEGTAGFDDIEILFRSRFDTVERCDLMISYRSSPAITRLFASLLPEDARREISSVLRDDVMPAIIACDGEESHLRELADAVRAAADEPGLTAVIVPWKSDVKPLMRKLEASLDAATLDRVSALRETDRLLESGVVVLPLKLAKGLEFDGVVIPDASADVFGADDLSRRRLYTSVSRATVRATILSKGPLTPLLDVT